MSKLFLDRLDEVEKEANDIGLTLTDITRGVKISRATPDRWRASIPNTIALLDQMDAWVTKEREKRARSRARG